MRIRIACHVHSDWSFDGKWPLGRLADEFSKRKYNVILITEHDKGFDESRRLAHRNACQKASTKDILLLPGIEYSDPSNIIHMLVWGNIPFIGSSVRTMTVLAAVQAGGGVVVFAHPGRRDAWRLNKSEWGNSILGIELWNRKSDGWAPSEDARLLFKSTQALPFVSMDFHDSRQFFPLAMIAEIEPPLTEERVLASLKSRCWGSEAFGYPISFFSGGVTRRALRASEFLRRKAAALFRSLYR